MAQAFNVFAVSGPEPKQRGKSGSLPLTPQSEADHGVERRFLAREMTFDEARRVLDGEELVPFAGQAPGGEGFAGWGIEGDGPGGKEGGFLLTSEPGVPREVKAELDTAGMKTPSPVAWFVGAKIVPFDTDPVLAITAVEALPAAAEGLPHAGLGEVAGWRGPHGPPGGEHLAGSELPQAGDLTIASTHEDHNAFCGLGLQKDLTGREGEPAVVRPM